MSKKLNAHGRYNSLTITIYSLNGAARIPRPPRTFTTQGESPRHVIPNVHSRPEAIPRGPRGTTEKLMHWHPHSRRARSDCTPSSCPTAGPTVSQQAHAPGRARSTTRGQDGVKMVRGRFATTYLPRLDTVPEARIEASSGDTAWRYAGSALLEPSCGPLLSTSELYSTSGRLTSWVWIPVVVFPLSRVCGVSVLNYCLHLENSSDAPA